ncbi:uncharacterized protein N7496_003817 [Penicillium cataractarum]|uniref:Uncharacterized protein n=1 Tax=Penicillium cataractarum TaxID=2100454 RepID=A0A9W9SPC3_9EURO|nr:uncharacterized protein N7496_003817 [Penicillium cataractarum]KAJ5381389.1 hypothetical protein N7496_003817 [Penicillium cataractarum]
MLFDLIKKHVGSLNNSQESGWRPSYLRKRILILFLIAFSAIIAALEALYQSSEAHDGIAASTESRHYLWTYGPTAILTIIATFWSRVEFQSKQNAPWQSMLEAPQPAGKSVLLDYISDMQPVAMWKAFKNKHLIVFSGVSCSLLLQLMIVFSTGLFSLQETQVHKSNVPIQLHDIFTTEDSKLDTVGSQPWDIINGILFDNLTYPDGTNENLTFQEFSAPSLSSSAIVTAPIDGLAADLDCDLATLDKKELYYLTSHFYKDGSFEKNAVIQSFQLATSSCKITTNNLITNGATQAAFFQGGQCENINGADGKRIVVSLLKVSTTDHKFRTTPPADLGIPASNETWWGVDIALNRSLTFICKPTLSLIKLQAEANGTELSSDVRLKQLGYENTTLPGVTAGDISELISKNSSDTSGFRSVEYYSPFPTDTYVYDCFKLGLCLIGVNVTIENMWRDGVLRDASSAYYRAMTAQLMHIGLVQKETSTTTGSAITNENRVIMMQLPLRGIEACLVVVMLLACLMIMYTAHRTTATWNPAHISAIAAITAESDDFRDSLRGSGATSAKGLQGNLAGQRFFSEPTSRKTSIKVLEDETNATDSDESVKSKNTEWKPFPGFFSRIVIFFLVAAMIVALEVLLHFSQVNDGLGDASSTNEYMHYLWTIIPALTMSSTSLLFGSMDFNTRCLAPYARLRHNTGSLFQNSMDISFLDSLGLNNTFRSMRSRHFAVQATTIATGAAFFLTIIVSGLYSTIEVPFHVAVNFTRIGGFPDPRTIAGAQLLMDETGEVAGILTAEYILQYNFSYPRWTYDELAFAEVSMNESSQNDKINGSYVDIRVPALRAAPVCHLQTAQDLLPNLTSSGNETFALSVQLNELACPGNNTNALWNDTIFSGQRLGSQPFGYSIETDCNSESRGLTGASHYTVSYVWGYVEDKAIKHIMGMACIQYAETVDVLTRFKLPGMDIDEEHPPVPDESSAKLAPNLYTPIPEWWVLNSNGVYPTFDGFFQLLVSGRYAISVDNFQSAKGNKTVTDAIKHQHKLINAQQFGNYTRGTANDTIKHSSLLGNVTTTDRLRLVQDATSTRILDGLLASMLILGIIGTWLLNTDHVLPKSPCSIAAVASLLADSKLLDQFVQGVWRPEDKSLNQTFAHRRFYLGWWQDESSEAANIAEIFTIDHTATDKESSALRSLEA